MHWNPSKSALRMRNALESPLVGGSSAALKGLEPPRSEGCTEWPNDVSKHGRVVFIFRVYNRCSPEEIGCKICLRSS